MHEIMFQAGIDRGGVLFRFQQTLVNADQLLATARILTKDIVGNTVEPGREARFSAKTANVFVGAQESLLGQIVRQGQIRTGELAQKSAYTRLMAPDQLAESMLVFIDKNSSDEIGIGKLHATRLRQRRRVVSLGLVISSALQFPDKEVTGPDEEGNDSNGP